MTKLRNALARCGLDLETPQLQGLEAAFRSPKNPGAYVLCLPAYHPCLLLYLLLLHLMLVNYNVCRVGTAVTVTAAASGITDVDKDDAGDDTDGE